MTDKNTIDTRPTADETKEIRIRISKFSGNKFNTNNKHAREKAHSPSLGASLYYEKGKLKRIPPRFFLNSLNFIWKA